MSNDSPDESSSDYDIKPLWESAQSTNSAKSLVAGSVKSGSSLCSPKAKRVKMVHGLDETVGEVNDVYLEQLNLIRKRVSLLDLTSGQSATCDESASITVRTNSDDETENIIEELELTPRKIEVPPKKRCLGLDTPSIAPTHQPNVKFKSIWTDSSKESPNTSVEIEFETYESHKNIPLEPNIIVLRSSPPGSSSNSSAKLSEPETPTNVTGTNTKPPQCNIAAIGDYAMGAFRPPCKMPEPTIITKQILSPDAVRSKYNNCLVRKDIDLDEMAKLYSTGPKIRCQIDKNEYDKTYLAQFYDEPMGITERANAFTIAILAKISNALQSGIQRMLRFRHTRVATLPVTKSEQALEDEELEYFPDEVVMRLINYSDYDIPLRNMGELPNVKSTKHIVSNLAAEVFRGNSANRIDAKQEFEGATTSFKELVRGIKQEQGENNTGGAKERTASFKNIFTERRRQATNLEYYNVEKLDVDELSDNETSITKNDNPNQYIPLVNQEGDTATKSGCCNLQACAEFMFPKRVERYF